MNKGTIKNIFNNMSESKKNLAYGLIGKAVESGVAKKLQPGYEFTDYEIEVINWIIEEAVKENQGDAK